MQIFVIDNGWFGEYTLQEGTIFPAEKHAHDVRINQFWLFFALKSLFSKWFRLFGFFRIKSEESSDLDLPIEGTLYTARDVAVTDPEENCKWCDYCYLV